MDHRTEAIRSLVADALRVPIEDVPDDASAESVDGWDSMAQLNICMRFQERFNVDMDIESIEKCTSVASLASLLPK